jgi:hypothetical protein
VGSATMKHFKAVLFSIVLFCGHALRAADYYVNAATGNDTTGNGTQGASWQTIGRALSIGLNPGDVVHVAPGTYYGQVLVNASGAPGQPITVVCDVRWQCLVRGSNYSSAVGRAVFLLAGDYINVINFDVADGDGSGAYGIEGYGTVGSYLVQGNYVHDIPVPKCDSNGGAAIGPEATSGGGHSYVTANLVTRIGNVSQCGRANGVYLSGNGSVATNNVIYNVWGTGIDISHLAQNTVAAFNTVDSTQRGNGVGGVGVYLSCDSTACNNNQVVNNIVTNSVAAIENNQPGINNVLDHNLFFGNQTNSCEGTGPSVCTNTVVGNPNYVNQAGGDFHLGPASAAIGSASSLDAPSRDFDGNPRPFPGRGTFDIGAYVFNGMPAASFAEPLGSRWRSVFAILLAMAGVALLYCRIRKRNSGMRT